MCGEIILSLLVGLLIGLTIIFASMVLENYIEDDGLNKWP